MFFVLSKTASFFILPSNVLFAIGLIGLLLLATRWRRLGCALMAVSIVLLGIIGFLPVGGVLINVLESRFPPWDSSRGAPDGIIVLGGAINPRLSRAYGETQLNSNTERVTVIPKLARTYPNARIVFSGGDTSLMANEGREVDFLYPLLETLGVPRDRVLLEGRARNTYENALYTKKLVKPKPGERWLLVTSAEHMPRAIGCFRRVDFPVEAYPVGWNKPPSVDWWPTGRLASGLNALDHAAHEWIGLIVYRLSGRSSVFFPSPSP